MTVGRPKAALFVLVFSAYAYFYQAGGWNQNSRFDLTRSLVEERTTRIDSYHRNTGDKARRDGHYYCDKAPGLSLLAVPAYAVIAPFRGDKPSPRFLATAAYVSTVFSVAIPSAIAVLLLFELLLVLGLRQGPACALAAAYGLGTLAFPYATLLYGHQLAAALSTIDFALLVLERHSAEPARGGRLFVAGLSLGFAVVVEYPSALVGVPLGIWLATWMRRPKDWAVFAAGAAIPALICATYHAVAFGGPLVLPYEFSTQPHRSQGFFMGLGAPQGEAIRDLTFSSYRGLFFSAPWLLAALPGAIRLARVRRGEALVCTAIAVLFFWLNSSLVDWQGGWAMGPRYLVPSLPFLAILVGGLALPARQSKSPVSMMAFATAMVLAVYSFFLMLVGTSVKPEVPTHLKAPFDQYLWPAFRSGRLSISTQSIDNAAAPPKGESLAFNLGQLLGLEGRASLVPLVALLVLVGLALAWWATRTRAD